MKIKRNLLMLLLILFQFNLSGQIILSTSVTQNYNCDGLGCNYTGPSILINEVMLMPTTFDGSIFGDGPGFGVNQNSGEWIELYNPDQCYPKDISGFLLGNNAVESGSNYGGGFVIPSGTIVPSRGFCVIRGVNATPVPSNLLIQNGGNTIEIVVNSSNSCIGGGYRLWFPNSGGWFAFYDNSGNPQDAISWASTSNSCATCNPCVPSSSSFSGSLSPYNSIPSSMKTYISSVIPSAGFTFRRYPDGGSWQISSPSSPTLGTCNGPCVLATEINCNGTALVNASGGTPPYSYFWNGGSSPLNDLDSGLCAGPYVVVVTDNLGTTASATVDIPNWVPSSTFTLSPDTFCINNSSMITYTGDASDSATYAWTSSGVTLASGVGMGPHVLSSDNEGVHSVSLIVSENGCQSLPTSHDLYAYTISSAITVVSTPLCYQSATGSIVANGLNGIEPYVYHWNNSVENANNPNVIAGDYVVTVTDAIGCTNSSMVTLVDQTPLVVLLNKIDETCPNSCDGSAIVHVSGSVPPYVYQWQGNSSAIDSVTSYCSGSYEVTITDVNNCSFVADFLIEPASDILAIANANPTNGVAPADIQFSFSGVGANTFQWDFGDGLSSTEMNPIHQYLLPGVYTVVLIVTSGAPNFCSDSVALNVEIVPPSEVIIPNIFTPNSDGINDDFFAVSSGIENETMKIYNRWGGVVFSSEKVSEPWRGTDGNGLELADGVYFYVYYAKGFDEKVYQMSGSITLMR